MRCVLLVAMVVATAGLTRGEDDRMKKLVATAAKAKKLANEEIEDEAKDTALILKRLKETDVATFVEVELVMKRRFLDLKRKEGQTNGEFVLSKGLRKRVTKESIFYYDDDDFLNVVADNRADVTADQFVELAKKWAVADSAAKFMIVASRTDKFSIPKEEAEAIRLLKLIQGK